MRKIKIIFELSCKQNYISLQAAQKISKCVAIKIKFLNKLCAQIKMIYNVSFTQNEIPFHKPVFRKKVE